jgi:hypothetical protein
LQGAMDRTSAGPRVSIDLPISIRFGFVPKGYRKSVPRIDARHGEIEINEFLLGENAGGFRIDLIGQMTHRN